MTTPDVEGSKTGGLLSARREQTIDNQFDELRKLQSRYQKLYDGAPDLYQTINTEGIIIDCNTACYKSLGYFDKTEVIGGSIFEHAAIDSVKAMQESFDEWRRNGVVINKEVWLKRKDGTTFPTLISATNLYDDHGELIGANAAIVDETEIYSARKQLETAYSIQDELIKIAAHELKAPLQPMLSYVELAKAGRIAPEKCIEIIEPQIRRLKNLTQEIMDAGRLEDGAMSYNKEKVDLLGIVNEAIDTARPLIHNEKSGVSVECQSLDEGKPTYVFVDKMRINQVLTNLISNAIKFTDKGVIKITVNGRTDGEEIAVKVTDSGTGIPGEVLPKLFGKFVTDIHGGRNNQGIGLGLYISKKIIEAHGGRIWAENNSDGHGATLAFSLPLTN